MSELGDKLTVSRVESLLRDHGWVRAEARKTGYFWRRLDPQSRAHATNQVFVPLEGTERVDRRLREVLEVVADDWNVPAAAVEASYSDAFRDRLQFKVMAPEMERGEIPFTYAARLVSTLEEMLWSGARAAHTPLAAHPRSAVRAVDRFLGGLSLGQTQPGSFVFQVFSPLAGEMQLSSLSDREIPEQDVPFERLAAIRLFDGMQAAQWLSMTPAQELEAPGLLENAIDQGLSANLCFALAEVSPDELPADFELQIAWASARRMPAQSARIRLESRQLQRLRHVGEALAKREPLPDFELTGRVDELRHVRTLGGGGRVVVTSADLPGLLRTVQIDLDDEVAYLTALRAHAERREATFRGTLHLGGTRAMLVDAELLDVEADNRR